MTELFPKVTNFFQLESVVKSRKKKNRNASDRSFWHRGGYMLLALCAILYVIIGAAKSAPKLVNTAESAGTFVRKMKKYSPNFSYQYFTGEAVSLVKWIIFAAEAMTLRNRGPVRIAEFSVMFPAMIG